MTIPAGILGGAVRAGSAYAAAVLSDNPDFFLRLQETGGATTAVDASPNGRNATIVGSPTLGVTGPKGKAVTLDGTGNQHIDVPSWTTGPAAFTVELWFKGTVSPPSNVYAMMSKNGNGGGWSLRAFIPAPYFSLTVYGEVSQGSTPSTIISKLTDGAWHHFVACYDTTTDTGKVYIDGVDSTSPLTLESFSYPTSDPVVIGRRNGGTGLAYNGSIAEPAFYSSVLSAARVAAHYAAAP